MFGFKVGKLRNRTRLNSVFVIDCPDRIGVHLDARYSSAASAAAASARAATVSVSVSVSASISVSVVFRLRFCILVYKIPYLFQVGKTCLVINYSLIQIRGLHLIKML